LLILDEHAAHASTSYTVTQSGWENLGNVYVGSSNAGNSVTGSFVVGTVGGSGSTTTLTVASASPINFVTSSGGSIVGSNTTSETV